MGKRKPKKSQAHRILFVIGLVCLTVGAIHDIKLIYDGLIAFGAGAVVEVFS